MKRFETTYQNSHLQALEAKKELENVRPAGLPVSQLRYKYNYLQSQGMIKANLDDFPTSTTVENCLSPGLFPSLGVSHKDFFQPRSKEYVRNIYERINVKIPDEVFEKLWGEALKRDGDRVCIETFRNILDEVTALKLQEGAGV